MGGGEMLLVKLADYLLEYSSNRVFDQDTDLIELYGALIKDTHTRLNPLKYALITVNASKQFQGSQLYRLLTLFLDLDEAIKFLDAAKQRLAGKTDAVFILQVA